MKTKMKKMTIEKLAISRKTEGETGGILIPTETEMMIGTDDQTGGNVLTITTK